MRKLLIACGLAGLMVGTVAGCGGDKKPTTSAPPTDVKPGQPPAPPPLPPPPK